VFELKHFDPSVNQNSRAPVAMKLRTQKDGCLQIKYENVDLMARPLGHRGIPWALLAASTDILEVEGKDVNEFF
jgi:hypothetical protein